MGRAELNRGLELGLVCRPPPAAYISTYAGMIDCPVCGLGVAVLREYFKRGQNSDKTIPAIYCGGCSALWFKGGK